MTNYLKEYALENNAESHLQNSAAAGATSFVLDTGEGALFPESLNGTATSAGDADTLNSTGIQAAGVVAGDTLYNVTDGSWCVVKTVSTNSVETTPLQGGSGNTWDNADVWVVRPFVVTLVQYNTQDTPSTGVAKRERALVRRTAGSDTLTVITRGHDGDSAQSFVAGDNVYLFVEKSELEGMFSGIKDNLTRIVAIEALYLSKDGTVALNNNTNFSARNAANNANVALFKLTSGDVLEFQTLPRNPSSRSITNDYDIVDKKYLTDNGIVAKFGGDGSDGAVDGSANITLAGSNNTYIVKNYSSWAAAQGGSKTVTVTPTGCIVHIKIQGDADFTNWTFNFAGKGGAGGNGGASVTGATTNGNDGTNGTAPSISTVPMIIGAGNKGIKGGASGGAGGAASTVTPTTLTNTDVFKAGKALIVACGAGGGGGGSGSANGGTNSGAGGAGGAGGGCLIVEVLGDVIFTSSTFNCNGSNGSNGSNSSGSTSAGGSGGGGGGGGCLVILYNGTATGSPTTNVAGGSGGTGGTGGGSTGGWDTGGGGGGGASVGGTGSAGTDGSNENGVSGGNGGTGISLVAQNTIFA